MTSPSQHECIARSVETPNLHILNAKHDSINSMISYNIYVHIFISKRMVTYNIVIRSCALMLCYQYYTINIYVITASLPDQIVILYPNIDRICNIIASNGTN